MVQLSFIFQWTPPSFISPPPLGQLSNNKHKIKLQLLTVYARSDLGKGDYNFMGGGGSHNLNHLKGKLKRKHSKILSGKYGEGPSTFVVLVIKM